ncbi:hypothetical protein PoB_000287500 [Plakobranchus ocellatus]|uniref:Uncharacterized protein n=1 Tax=Plakobranchus ocellatus TaxID=259542 RepID=A0AAV3XZV7_9GAST|nr:hypothetical protein PoB_000287500 [Plakobranchus ocellatus]
MSGRNSRVNGTKARKVRTTSAQPRPATPTVPPTPDPRRRHRRARQDKVVTAIRTFKDTARPIQPFPILIPSSSVQGSCVVYALCPRRKPFSRPIAPPSGE